MVACIIFRVSEGVQGGVGVLRASQSPLRSVLAGFISSLKAEGAGRNFQFFPDRRPPFRPRSCYGFWQAAR